MTAHSAPSGQNQMNGMRSPAVLLDQETKRSAHQRVDAHVDRPSREGDALPAAQTNLLQVLADADPQHRTKEVVHALCGGPGRSSDRGSCSRSGDTAPVAGWSQSPTGRTAIAHDRRRSAAASNASTRLRRRVIRWSRPWRAGRSTPRHETRSSPRWEDSSPPASTRVSDSGQRK